MIPLAWLVWQMHTPMTHTVCKATCSIIMVLRKHMRVEGCSTCTRVCAQTLQHARQGRTLELSGLKPTMLAHGLL